MADMLGKYELRGVLGKGAMGTVYEGFDPIIARRVAIKTLKLPDPDDHEAQDELARFKREAQAAGRLSHPNIVGVFDYGETPELAYIVMELVDGTTLKHVVDKKERFELAEIVRLMDALLAGLQFSHDRGVVHRDIKPANIMLTKAGEVKISDFGIARIESSSMTQAGTVLGTPAYMSPEQFMGQTVDSRTDLYSSGVLLYQLLTGEKPFEGGLTAIMHKVLNTEPPAPSALSVTVPHAFDAVVKRAMAKRPEDRFAAASEFAAAIRSALAAKVPVAAESFAIGDFGDGDATMVTTARPPPPPPPLPKPAAPSPVPAPAAKKGPPMALAAGGLLLLLILGAAGFLLLGKHAPAPVAQTAPTPAATPAPTPAPIPAVVKPPAPNPAPTPAPAPVMTAAARQAAIIAAIGDQPCALLDGSDATPPVISGLVSVKAEQTLEAALAPLAAATPPVAPQLNLRRIGGPYCGPLNVIRPYHPLFAGSPGLTLGLPGGGAPLRTNDFIRFNASFPASTKTLLIDYFQTDGTVYHVRPLLTPGATTLSQPIGQVGAPYGTDMLVAIAASAPIRTGTRPALEDSRAYLKALHDALSAAAAAGTQIATAAVPVVTIPAP